MVVSLANSGKILELDGNHFCRFSIPTRVESIWGVALDFENFAPFYNLL
jgi:hypothetical protein